MARFCGNVGYVQTVETAPGVSTEVATERPYYGDVLKNTRKLEKGDGLNDNLRVDNLISIVADAYATQNFFAIKYVQWMGASWKVTNADASQRPRIILTLGGVYNGPKAAAT